VFSSKGSGCIKGALQLLIINRYGEIRFAQVPDYVSTKSFVVLIIGDSKSFHLGAQGACKDGTEQAGLSGTKRAFDIGLNRVVVMWNKQKAYSKLEHYQR